MVLGAMRAAKLSGWRISQEFNNLVNNSVAVATCRVQLRHRKVHTATCLGSLNSKPQRRSVAKHVLNPACVTWMPPLAMCCDRNDAALVCRVRVLPVTLVALDVVNAHAWSHQRCLPVLIKRGAREPAPLAPKPLRGN